MFTKILAKIVGTKNEREIKRLKPIVAKINALEPQIQKLSDAELKAKTQEFKERLDRGESLDSLLPEAFAVVREASRRVLGMRHYDVQLMGGIVLHEGKIAEMKTGEGKTLVATLPAYLNALTGKGVHIVTVNDYLAKRDAKWMGTLYNFLGLSVGVIVSGMNEEERKRAYASDITYGTNNEFGFDYLRDNMKFSLEDMVQREHHYAIVDEVDSILIDEARTPLIISGPSEESTEIYYHIDKLVRHLKKDVHFTLDEKTKSAMLTEEGVAEMERLLGVENLYDPRHISLVHHINQALRAHHLFHRDVDYIVKDGKVIIVDEFTGRLMPGRRWSDGLHQAIEAKEGVKIEKENQTLATITFQNYFRMYEKLAGMTGTAETEAAEFKEIYNLDVVVIPTHKPMIRVDHPDVVYRTKREKFNAVVEEIEELHREGRPVLVGTTSIENSEILSGLLKKKKIPHQVLNAKYHEREAAIIAQAGRSGAVTIATNMAGRGVDILLGGNPEGLAKETLAEEGYDLDSIDPSSWNEALQMARQGEDPTKKFPERWAEVLYQKVKECQEDYERVKALGGLHIIGTERHESRRIDNQLRGRAGRQGDPGSSRFYLSLEDDLLRLFGSDKLRGIMDRLGIEEGEPIEHPFVSKAIEQAQKKVEAHHFEIRKHLLEYDDVMNKQREVIYSQRKEILASDNIRDWITDMVRDVCEGIVEEYREEKGSPVDWDLEGLKDRFMGVFGFRPEIKEDLLDAKELAENLAEQALRAYEEKEQEIGQDTMRQLERMFLLHTIDSLWKEHLLAMDHLREGIGLRGYAQQNPLQEYKREAFAMFSDLIERIKEQTLSFLYRVQVEREEEVEKLEEEQKKKPLRLVYSRGEETREEKPKKQPIRRGKKIGRNDPCPCGSGKKYKKCCGRPGAKPKKEKAVLH
ncbi:preprotein translocase, SecA subunit [Thermodesulfatator indicus DSM 15286]|uniref:Protein translocase subunit SecA n=1 Tax=Thermodesulfatator indicus (strain DSM 15286 / JCM 11887 / CIR29812) TaxID=667014 RepID=F8A925_THEID|nr:preprotein translocase subunit SecA [Thermodesulfatator indicus]AEH45153.1 preprotein translocase, SecA subunit [Thermodesulfatator indicus DSM 15286]